MQIQNLLWSKATSGPHIVFITFANLYLQTDFWHFDEENDIKNKINWLVQTFMNICNSWNHVMISLTLSRPAVFLGGGGGYILSLRHLRKKSRQSIFTENVRKSGQFSDIIIFWPTEMCNASNKSSKKINIEFRIIFEVFSLKKLGEKHFFVFLIL